MIILIWISAVVVVVLGAHVKEVAKFGPYGAHTGNGFPPPERPFPAFLSDASDDTKNSYFEILDNDKLSISEKKISYERLAAENNILDLYYQWEDGQNFMRKWLSEHVNDILKRLPDVKTEMERIMEDNEQTSKLQNKNIFDLNRKYAKEVAILNFIINQVLTNASRQGHFEKQPQMSTGGPKPFGDFDKVALHEKLDKLAN